MNRTNRPLLLGAILLVLGLAIALLYRSRPLGAGSAAPWSAPLVDRDLDRIGKDTLRVLVVVHPLTYEEFPGGTRGAEFELLERFAKHMGLPLRAVPVVEDSLLPLLQRGSGDLIAAQVHENRFGKAVALSAPLLACLAGVGALAGGPAAGPDAIGTGHRLDAAHLAVDDGYRVASPRSARFRRGYRHGFGADRAGGAGCDPRSAGHGRGSALPPHAPSTIGGRRGRW
ncbi:MAG: hypothetical protein IPI41_11900 [Flavobacteriales bacterium]|nr:hypothetical protein [Flavobacteriales bacterium]